MASSRTKGAAAVTAHADSFERQVAQRDVLRDLDRLVEKVAACGEELQRLRGERNDLQQQSATLQSEHEQLLRAAGAADRQALLEKMARLSELERAHGALLRERAETAARVAALIEKVDLLREAS